MDRRNMALGLACLGLVWGGCDGGDDPDMMTPTGDVFDARDFVCASGESPPCETTQPAKTEAQRTHEAPEGSAMSLTFVVHQIDAPAAEGERIAGFNVDGIDSGDGALDGTCQDTSPDFLGLHDPDHIGVDNGLSMLLPLVGTMLEAPIPELIAQQITDGSLLLLMQISDINDLEYDTEVTVQLSLGAVPGGEAPASTGGVLDPNQAFDIERNLGPAVTGDIFDGRVRFEATELPISFDISGQSISLSIASPEMRFDITADSITNGIIGGAVTYENILDIVNGIQPGAECSTEAPCEEGVQCLDTGFCESELVGTISQLASGILDINPCDEAGECPHVTEPASGIDPETCESISVGLTFGAIPATVN